MEECIQFLGELMMRVSTRFYATIFSRRVATVFIWMGVSFLGVGCLPQNLPTPVEAPTLRTYENFRGVNEVQTLSKDKLKVSWTPSEDPEVVAYNIYDVSNVFTPRLLKTVPSPLAVATLLGLTEGYEYAIRVRAANSQNQEDVNKNDVRAIPYGGVTGSIVISSTSATVTFSDASNADSILVYCKSGSDDFALMKTVTNVALTQTNLTGLKVGTPYTCRVAMKIGETIDNNNTLVTFTPIGQATHLAFTTQPGGAGAGQALSPQPVVQILDANENIVSAGADATAAITLTVSSASPTVGSIRGTTTVTAVGGIATFSGINLREAGVKVLTASKADTAAQQYGSPPLFVDSNQFTVSPDSVSSIYSSIVISPASGTLVANGNSSYTVTVTLMDQYQNPISGVKPQFASTNSSDTISQPTANTDVFGVTQGAISTTVSGARTLNISSPSGLAQSTVGVSFIPGPASKVAFTTQPSNAPAGAGTMANIQVAIQDVQGNTISSGTQSTANVVLSIFTNPGGGTLTGTATLAAVNGVATFTGLGISKTGNGYKLVANSSPLSTALSNPFNIVAGVPSRVVVTGPTSTLSGTCSTAFTIQLQDAGGNPANATANTLINITGLGQGSLYASASCAGSATGAGITFATGSNTKTLYLKDNKAESLTITATDPSTVLATGTKTTSIAPSQVGFAGVASVPAGRCTSALSITTYGSDGVAGNAVADTTFQVTGLSGSAGALYSASDCSGSALNPSSIPVLAGTSATTFYFKDNKAENLALTVSDPGGVLSTNTSLVNLSVLASQIGFTGPSSVVSGACSTSFSITLKDAQGNLVPAPAQQNLSIVGLAGKQGSFYASSSCSGAALGSTLAIPQGSSSSSIYFSDTTAESLALSIADPAAVLTTSPMVNLGVSPSALAIVAPGAGASSTNICAGPFALQARDGGGNLTAAITPITANLSGQGAAAAFYSDSACSTLVTNFIFSAGDSSETFYFKGLAPSGLSLTATDAASVLSSSTVAWTVNAAPAWIGTGSGALSWFEAGKLPTAPRFDGPSTVYDIHLTSAKDTMYLVDYARSRVLKYNYQTQSYVGWIGAYNGAGSIGITGSNVNGAINAQCISTPHAQTTPGWCLGGQSVALDGQGTGALWAPTRLTDDGNYVYVVSQYGFTVNRYVAATGAFAGWIGRVYSTPSGAGTGTSNSCSTAAAGNSTPGWCMGGTNYSNNTGSGGVGAGTGDGRLYFPHSIAYSATNGGQGGGPFIYVSNRGSIKRYNATTGAYYGWIGYVNNTPTGAAPDVTNTCASTAATHRTPGWCIGGGTSNVNPNTSLAGDIPLGGGVNDPTFLYVDDTNNYLYVNHTDNGGTFGKYNLATGAFLGNFKVNTFTSPYAMEFDGTYFYISDWNRIVKMDAAGVVYGWVGKVSNNTSMSGNPGCSTLVPNANTPGWCLGGSAKPGIDEQSAQTITAMAIDGNGNMLTGSYQFPAVKMWKSSDGTYVGQMTMQSSSPPAWTTSQEFAGYQGYDDMSLNSPWGVYNDGTNLYVAEYDGSRIKKINKDTGQVIGWIGGITSSPTGGASGCVGATAMAASPGWCLGAWEFPNLLWNSGMIPTTTDGLIYTPTAITGDSTYLYVTDSLNRVIRFNKSTGLSAGWIGFISSAPTGGATGCNGASGFTPGWCTGGTSTSTSTSTGGMNGPVSIVYLSGNLYVFDSGNYRINGYNATTGAFLGWTGQIATTPTGGTGANCNKGAGFYTNGFCVGGTSARESITLGSNPGGGFYPWGYQRTSNGLATDGTYLYVANGAESRVDKFSAAGVYQSSFPAAWNSYTGAWTSNPTTWTWNNYSLDHIWVDATGTYLYGVGSANFTGGNVVVKYNLATGAAVGWKGGIAAGGSPTNPASCVGATGVTPDWCQFGTSAWGYTMGKFSSYANGITGDANFVYITDFNTNRITRLPK